MRRRSFCQKLMWGLAVGIAFCAHPRASWADGSLTVAAGYDLFETTTGSSYGPLGPLVGVPLGTFNFGGGSVATGNADTIVQRVSPVTVPAAGDTGMTGLVVNALQMETATPINLGNGLNNYFVTLTPTAASTGMMNITFASTAGGTFTSTLDIFFDVHQGALNGPVVLSSEAVLSNSGAPWERIPPPGAVVIDGVNHNLDGKDMNQDFWPGVPNPNPNGQLGIVTESNSGLSETHVVTTATTPEPSTWIMLVTAGLIVPAYARWGRQRA
jgi:hypothetical protein